MTSGAAASTPARPAWVPEELYPLQSRYAGVAGSLVHYLDEGAGPPLLLLHGNPTWSFLYRDILGNTWAWPKADPGTQLFSRLLGGPIGRRLIAHRNLFVEVICRAACDDRRCRTW